MLAPQCPTRPTLPGRWYMVMLPCASSSLSPPPPPLVLGVELMLLSRISGRTPPPMPESSGVSSRALATAALRAIGDAFAPAPPPLDEKLCALLFGPESMGVSVPLPPLPPSRPHSLVKICLPYFPPAAMAAAAAAAADPRSSYMYDVSPYEPSAVLSWGRGCWYCAWALERVPAAPDWEVSLPAVERLLRRLWLGELSRLPGRGPNTAAWGNRSGCVGVNMEWWPSNERGATRHQDIDAKDSRKHHRP